jgi:hypothetical protein
MGVGALRTAMAWQRVASADQRLDLRLLVDRQHHRPARRLQAEPDDVGDLLGELRIPTDLERASWCGRKPVSLHNFAT